MTVVPGLAVTMAKGRPSRMETRWQLVNSGQVLRRFKLRPLKCYRSCTSSTRCSKLEARLVYRLVKNVAKK